VANVSRALSLLNISYLGPILLGIVILYFAASGALDAMKAATTDRTVLMQQYAELTKRQLTIVSDERKEIARLLGSSKKNIVMEVKRIPSTSLSQSQSMQLANETMLIRFPQVACVFSRTGTPDVAAEPMPASASDTYIILKPREQWADPDLAKDSAHPPAPGGHHGPSCFTWLCPDGDRNGHWRGSSKAARDRCHRRSDQRNIAYAFRPAGSLRSFLRKRAATLGIGPARHLETRFRPDRTSG
jgi:hypothetical protein